MKIHFVLILGVLAAPALYGQKPEQPKSVEHAVEILLSDCPDSLQSIIKQTPNDSLIYLIYPHGGEYKTLYAWTSGRNEKETKLEKYYAKLGVKYYQHIETIVLIAFKTRLLGEALDHEKVMEPYQALEQKWRKEDEARFTTDTLRGEYIPKDLEDCFVQINSFWNDSTRAVVKAWTEDEFSANAHFGFGMWMRNNWQLWGGSRLSKYFNDMGIYHPDDMSGIILDSYHRRLTGKEIKLEEQVKFYQDYWKQQEEGK